MTNKILLILLVAFMLFLSGCLKAPEPTETMEITGSAVDITIQGNKFIPSEITISKGTTVTWTNKDARFHTVTGNSFDSGNLAFGKTYAKTFDEIGTFDYICTIHPFMKGKIIVE